MSTVQIMLRWDAPAVDSDGEIYTVYATRDDVDLDRLSPRARALAEAIAASPLSAAADIWMESDKTIRERVPGWENWYRPEQADRPERRPWRGWAKYPATSDKDPHTYLEQQAAKVPPGWHVLGHTPRDPVPTQAYGLTAAQVVAYLHRCGRFIGTKTWSGYVARGTAPQPADRVGREPLWDPDEIIAWAQRPDLGKALANATEQTAKATEAVNHLAAAALGEGDGQQA